MTIATLWDLHPKTWNIIISLKSYFVIIKIKINQTLVSQYIYKHEYKMNAKKYYYRNSTQIIIPNNIKQLISIVFNINISLINFNFIFLAQFIFGRIIQKGGLGRTITRKGGIF